MFFVKKDLETFHARAEKCGTFTQDREKYLQRGKGTPNENILICAEQFHRIILYVDDMW